MRWIALIALLGVGACSEDIFYAPQARAACEAHQADPERFEDCVFRYWQRTHARIRPSPGH